VYYLNQGESPAGHGGRESDNYAYLLRLSMQAFYPMIFDVAKRSRVTVEAMEARGFSGSLKSEASRQLQLEGLRVRWYDIAFFGGSLGYVVAVALLP
jgi:energy-coupling factor transport system permease protein